MHAPKSLATIILFLGLVGCDHVTKSEAKRELEGRPPVVLAEGLLDLEYRENHGIAFNAERILPEPLRLPILGLLTLAISVGVGVAWWRRRAELSLHALGYASIAAGAVGNLADRVNRGYVVDFIHIHGWPVFNIADVAVGLGIALLLLGELRGRLAHRSQ